jgi:hypothetical protein
MIGWCVHLILEETPTLGKDGENGNSCREEVLQSSRVQHHEDLGSQYSANLTGYLENMSVTE